MNCGLRFSVGLVLVCACLTLPSSPAEAAKKKKKKGKSLVGKPMPKVDLGQIYNGERLAPTANEALKGCAWILVLVKVNSPQWDWYREMLWGIHRPQRRGGPFVVALDFDSAYRVEEAIEKWQKAPAFTIAGDNEKATLVRDLRTGVIPQFYIIDEKGTVTWQGTSSADDFKEVFKTLNKGDIPRLKDSVPRKPTRGKKSSGSASGKKLDTAQFKAEVEEAIRSGDSVECLRLLYSVWKKDERPEHDLLAQLWDYIEASISIKVKPAHGLIEKRRYASARKKVRQLREEYEGFPSKSLDDTWKRLAEREGFSLYGKAERAFADGDTKTGRAMVRKLNRYYPDTKWAKKANQLEKP